MWRNGEGFKDDENEEKRGKRWVFNGLFDKKKTVWWVIVSK